MCWHTLIGCIYIYIYIYFLISYWLYIQLYHRSNRNIIEINIPFKRKCLFQYFVLYSLIRMEYRRDTKKEGFSQSCTLYHAICIAHIDFKLPLQTVFYFIFWQKEFRTSILNDSFLSLNENINQFLKQMINEFKFFIQSSNFFSIKLVCPSNEQK